MTGAAEHGGLQIIAYPMNPAKYEELRQPVRVGNFEVYHSPSADVAYSFEMGLAPGGLMDQEIYKDDYGFNAWETSVRSRCFVHILNSLQYAAVCGVEPPNKPPTAAQYTAAGPPWFEYYGGDLEALEGASALAGLDSVAAKKWKQGALGLEGNEPVRRRRVRKLGRRRVSEGEF